MRFSGYREEDCSRGGGGGWSMSMNCGGGGCGDELCILYMDCVGCGIRKCGPGELRRRNNRGRIKKVVVEAGGRTGVGVGAWLRSNRSG